MISVSTVGLRNWLHCIRCGSRGILRNCLVSVFHWCLMCFNLRMPEPAWISVIGLTAPATVVKFMIYVNFQSSIWDVFGIEFRMVKPNTVFVTSKWVVKLDCTLEDLVNALKLIFINMFFTAICPLMFVWEFCGRAMNLRFEWLLPSPQVRPRGSTTGSG